MIEKIKSMWKHYCSKEQTDLYVGCGECCSWCGKSELDKQ